MFIDKKYEFEPFVIFQNNTRKRSNQFQIEDCLIRSIVNLDELVQAASPLARAQFLVVTFVIKVPS